MKSLSLIPLDKNLVKEKCVEVLDRVRQHRAKQDEETIVSYMVGFNTPSFFRKIFKLKSKVIDRDEAIRRLDCADLLLSYYFGWRSCYAEGSRSVAEKLLSVIEYAQSDLVYISPEDWSYISP